MTNILTPIAPGTRVRILSPDALPSNDYATDPFRTTLDPAHYTISPPTGSVMVLVATPNGWGTRVRDGLPDAGTEVKAWWVSKSMVEVVQDPSPVPLLSADEAHRGMVAACEQRDAMARSLDEVTKQRDAQKEETARLMGALADARRALDTFRAEVRTVAIRVAEEQGWCDEGLNDVLAELGMEPKETEWEVEVEVTARQTVTVRVTAKDEAEAQEKIVDGEVDVETDRSNWEWQTADDLDFLSTEQA